MKTRSFLLAPVLALLALPALAGGPPVLLVETPAAPFDEASTGAVAIVRAYQCGAPLTAPVTATAYGVVDGKTVAKPIHLTVTSQPGVYAVKPQWSKTGRWVLAFSCRSHGHVTTLVEMQGNATPKDPSSAVRMVHREVPRSEIEALLRG